MLIFHDSNPGELDEIYENSSLPFVACSIAAIASETCASKEASLSVSESARLLSMFKHRRTLSLSHGPTWSGTSTKHAEPAPSVSQSLQLLCYVDAHILKTPKGVSGNGAFSDAAIPRARTVRVSRGSMIPSSHRRAVL